MHKRGLGVLAVMSGLATAVATGAALIPLAPAGATSSVAQYVMSPDPIGSSVTTPAGTTVPVAVTAETSTGTPVPGATIYLSFNPVAGGGTAAVGTTALSLKPTAFTADSSGLVQVSYTAPSTYPTTSARDTLKAENAATDSGSTVKATDHFYFTASPVTSLVFAPRPIAPPKTLAANTAVTVTLAVKGASGPLPDTGVYLKFAPTTGGGKATVGATALTATYRLFKSNSSGMITITYTTPATLPTSGADHLDAGTALKHASARARDSYQF